MKMKNMILLSFIFFLMSCYDDKGNYDYREMAEIKIENLPETLEILGGIEHIVAQPKVTSSLEGEIKDGNPNFEFSYKLEKKGGSQLYDEAWVDLNPSKSLKLDTLISIPSGNYVVWFAVKDKRSSIEYSTTFDVKVTSSTYEGWLVLCNEGEEKRVRMDMISVISADRIEPAYDLLSLLGLPDLKKATKIGFYPAPVQTGDVIYLMSEEGTYKLDQNTFETSDMYNIYTTDFIVAPSDPDENIIEYMPLANMGPPTARAIFAVSNKGNVYALVTAAGAAFEMPINTSVRGKSPEYRVAPYVGISMVRYPGNSTAALFYDIDNKRFVGWSFKSPTTNDINQILTPVPNPEVGKLFDFKTGMDLVYMEGTSYSNGLVYAILQNASGKRVIYGINMSGAGFVQESIYENLNAPDFDKATVFAFHSQFPYMFYGVENKVYLHNLGTNITYEMTNIGLSANEEVTMLKFNLYHNNYWWPEPTEEFMARQYELMVGTYDNRVSGVDGGKLGFYKVDGANNSITKRVEYSGFARIKDVRYRERR